MLNHVVVEPKKCGVCSRGGLDDTMAECPYCGALPENFVPDRVAVASIVAGVMAAHGAGWEYV